MTNFRDFLLLQESLTRKTNYIRLDQKYINMFNQKVVKDIIQKGEIPYHIVVEEQDDSYSRKITGQVNPAKSMILKYNFA